MKYSKIAIIIIFFLFIPLFAVNAILALELAINNEQKKCQSFQPTREGVLPDGWEYHNFPKASYISAHKEECEKLGYAYIGGMLPGKSNPIYLTIIFIYNAVFVASLIVCIAMFVKTKKKKILIALPVIIVLYLFLYLVNSFII